MCIRDRSYASRSSSGARRGGDVPDAIVAAQPNMKQDRGQINVAGPTRGDRESNFILHELQGVLIADFVLLSDIIRCLTSFHLFSSFYQLRPVQIIFNKQIYSLVKSSITSSYHKWLPNGGLLGFFNKPFQNFLEMERSPRKNCKTTSTLLHVKHVKI